MEYPDFLDPYLDMDTGVLSNKLGITSQTMLDEVEGALVYASSIDLQQSKEKFSYDLEGFRAIHRRLFRDVFDWAGEIRTIDMRKNIEGAEFFLPFQMIEQAFAYCSAELAEDGYLHGLPRDNFVEKIAYHYDQINYIHPFREGNGRVQRIFWSQLAKEAGWKINWHKVTGAQNDDACMKAIKSRDLDPLYALFEKALEEI